MALPNRAQRRAAARAGREPESYADTYDLPYASRPSRAERLARSLCRGVRVLVSGAGVLIWAVLAGSLAGSWPVGLVVLAVLSFALWYERDINGQA